MSKILIVEDEEAIADLERDYLELSGFTVEVANDGDTGLQKALNEDYDLLILDLMLPGTDGFDILSLIHIYVPVHILIQIEPPRSNQDYGEQITVLYGLSGSAAV